MEISIATSPIAYRCERIVHDMRFSLLIVEINSGLINRNE